VHEILTLTCLLVTFPGLPRELTASLDSSYPGWKPAAVAPQISAWFREYGFAFAPNLISGDFDSDGRRDWAAYIAQGEQSVLVAAMSGRSRWTLHELARDAADPFTYLLLHSRGEKDFDFRTLRHFRHHQDSIALMYFSRTPVRFAWKNGRFETGLIPNDEE
jgi:hypothetical protein